MTAALLALLLAGCATFVLDPPRQALIERDADDVVDASEIIVLVDSAEAANSLVAKALKREYRLRSREYLDGIDLYLISLEIPPGMDGAAAIRELERLEPRATAGVNHRYTLQMGETPRRPRVFAHDMIGWP
ncbi:MAG: hypothetical protein AAF527_01085, partial [Pseudomonadota bacterium]